MSPDIVEQLNKLKEKWPDEESQGIIRDWEKGLKTSSLWIDLQNHAAFKMLSDKLHEEEDKIRKELSTNESLFLDENGRMAGVMLHARLRFIRDFLRPFRTAKVDHEYTRKKVSEGLEDEPKL